MEEAAEERDDSLDQEGMITCFRCGREASRGKRVSFGTDERPAWSWIGFVFGIVPGLLLRDAMAKPGSHFAYSLCPRCSRIRRAKQGVAWGLWALWFLSVLMTAITRSETWGTFVFLLFIAAIVATATAVSQVETPNRSYRHRA